jgi:undecaprenyl-diphosphatase
MREIRGMDPFKAVDTGANYFFRNLAEHHRGLEARVQAVDLGSGYVAAAVLLLLAVIVFCLRGHYRTAAVAVAVSAAAVLVVEGLRRLIARPRPDAAQDYLGAEELGSYPAQGVFLFTMTLLLLTFALASGARRWVRVVLSFSAALLIVAASLMQFFLGLHFVTDVLGGLLGGGACALLTWLLSGPHSQTPETVAKSPV